MWTHQQGKVRMDSTQVSESFREAFVLASTHTPAQYSYSIRIFTAILCIVTTAMIVTHFLRRVGRDSDVFEIRFIALIVKLLIVVGILLLYLL